MAVRPIDANAMLSELRPVSFEAEHSAVLLSDVSKMMREWVERQPTLTPPNEWVSVEERLPEPGKDVLLYFGEESRISVGGRYDVGDGWYAVIVNEYETICDTAPRSWMPLPAPPDRRQPEGDA